MPIAQKQVHVYADAETVYLVPLKRLESGLWVECLPVSRLSLASVLGDDRALNEGLKMVTSYSEHVPQAREPERWNGENGRLWSDNRLFIAIKWYADHVTLARKTLIPGDDEEPPGWADRDAERLPADTSVAQISGLIIDHLKEMV